jgi:hypothetical protein
MNTVDVSTRSTQAFIDENPSTVMIRRAALTMSRDRARQRGDEVSHGPVTIRLLGRNPGLVGFSESRLDEDGERMPSHNIVAMPDADIQPWDEIDIDDKHYRVLWVADKPAWRKIAEVIEHA